MKVNLIPKTAYPALLWQQLRGRWKEMRKNKTKVYYALQMMVVLSIAPVLIITAFIVSVTNGVFGNMPSDQNLLAIQYPVASEIYSSDSVLLGRFYLEQRSLADFTELSPHLINALVATEDARYYDHNGIDYRAWARVFFKSILMKDRSSGGGSTISQQLAKNLYPREGDGGMALLINKLKEAIIAQKLERLYSKKQILELYLNTVAFSENTYGVKVAAQRFFNTSPSQLRPEQAATLVAMLKATSTYNPVSHPKLSKERRNLVLDQMEKYDYLTTAEKDSLQKLALNLNYFPLNNNVGLATYFREHLRLDLKERLQPLRKKESGLSYNIYTDGLKIYTTIHSKMQAFAEEAVKEQIADLQKTFHKHLDGKNAWEKDTIIELAVHQSPRYRNLRSQNRSKAFIDSVFQEPVHMLVFDWEQGEKKVRWSPLDSIRYYNSLLNAGFMVSDPQTGAIQAWVGGINHKYFKYDHTQSKRQVGSTFKPVVYAKAIQRGIHPCSYTLNTLRTYTRYENWQPKNADDKYGGLYSMQGGLTNSVNTVTVSLMMRSGPKRVAQLAEDLGIDAPVPGVPSIALGTVDASLREMTNMYSTFANRGLKPELRFIDRIVTKTGEVVLDYAQPDTSQWKRALSVDEADMINEMLQATVTQGTARRLRYRYQFTYPFAGKTGTSQNHSDGWFMGFTPKMVAGAWVGAESPLVRFRDLRLGQGANTALPIFARFVQKLETDPKLRSLIETDFPEPSQFVKDQLNCQSIQWPKKEATATETVAQSIPEILQAEE
ncbi:MAG: transglycosylase domain-containing protein [Saprospiraceae bacterium]|nr:transglycosylase domain-containing protein [Saprospiraceae bacterium]